MLIVQTACGLAGLGGQVAYVKMSGNHIYSAVRQGFPLSRMISGFAQTLKSPGNDLGPRKLQDERG